MDYIVFRSLFENVHAELGDGEVWSKYEAEIPTVFESLRPTAPQDDAEERPPETVAPLEARPGVARAKPAEANTQKGTSAASGSSSTEGTARVGGDPTILGPLDRAVINGVVRRHMNQIRACYQRELTGSPGLAGTLVVKFVVAKDGSGSTASKKSGTLDNRAVEDCVTGRFRRMTFPPPKGGGIVSYPFVFG